MIFINVNIRYQNTYVNEYNQLLNCKYTDNLSDNNCPCILYVTIYLCTI